MNTGSAHASLAPTWGTCRDGAMLDGLAVDPHNAGPESRRLPKAFKR